MTPIREADFSLNLAWQGGQRFQGTSGKSTISLDGTEEAGLSPVHALAYALAGCMGIDVVDVIEKGRFALKSVDCRMQVYRAEAIPRKIIGVDLHFAVQGEVPEDRVARAIALSREKYCSVWHSLDPAIDFKTSFAVNP